MVDKGSVVSVVLPLVCKFLDVFSKDLTELPLHWEIEFSIDLIPGIVPISVPPYHFAPAVLQELKVQIQNFLSNLVHHHGELQLCLLKRRMGHFECV